MIRLGLRLTVNGGKESAVRLVVTAMAVALGVGLLLITVGGMNALNAQNARSAWLNTGPSGPSGPVGQVDPLWWQLTIDQFGNRSVDRVDLAGTGASSPVPPGIPRLPGPGQFYASPALSRLLQSTPADQLSDRFPGQQIGTIGAQGLPAPNTLIVVIGRTADELSASPRADQVTTLNTEPTINRRIGFDPSRLQVILAVGALALLFPVLVFIGTATRLAAARREQRFASMRLVGATPRQVSVIAAVEASIAALGGVAGGFGLFFLFRPLLAKVSFTGEPFFTSDLSLGLTGLALVAIGVPLAAAVAARVALRRVQISPLGVSRRVTPPAPRAYRLVPLLAGIAELGYFVLVGHPKTTGSQIDGYLLGFFLIMAGLVVAGPWLIMVGSRVMARRTSRPAMLIAGRRLSDNPRAAFRSISGLILALFVSSVAVGITTTIITDHSAKGDAAAARAGLVSPSFGPQPAPGQGSASSSSLLPDMVLSQVRSTRGVLGVTMIYSNPLAAASSDGAALSGLVSCAALARTPALGHCAAGASVATINPTIASDQVTDDSGEAATTWPTAPISAQRLESLRLQSIVVGTDGSRAAIERVRTTLEVALPDRPIVASGDISTSVARTLVELQHMANIVLLASLVIAGCSLAVSVTAGVSDRRLPFSLLRLAGAPLGVLRRVVALEAGIPLLVIAVVSAGTGLAAADLFLRSQLGESLRMPGVNYYLIVLAGIAGSLAVVASTLPLIERITGPEVGRNE